MLEFVQTGPTTSNTVDVKTVWKSLETYLSFHGLATTSTECSCDLDVWLKTWLDISFTQKNSLDVPNFNEVTGSFGMLPVFLCDPTPIPKF